MTIKEALKNYQYDKHGMSDKFIIKFIEIKDIADDRVEDSQTYINELSWECGALASEFANNCY